MRLQIGADSKTIARSKERCSAIGSSNSKSRLLVRFFEPYFHKYERVAGGSLIPVEQAFLDERNVHRPTYDNARRSVLSFWNLL